jgi:hypothetical protein
MSRPHGVEKKVYNLTCESDRPVDDTDRPARTFVPLTSNHRIKSSLTSIPRVLSHQTGATQRASIKRRQNASTGQLEYMLENVSGMSKMVASVVISASTKKASSVVPQTSKSAAKASGI